MLCPYHPAVSGAALTAEQQAAERVFAAVFARACGNALSAPVGLYPAPCHFKLHCIELLSGDDGIMVILDQVLGPLAGVLDHLFTDAVPNEGLLPQDIAAVFFVAEDRSQIGSGPLCGSRGVPETPGLQRFLDAPQCFPRQIHFINQLHCFRLLRYNHHFTIRTLFIAQQGFELNVGFAGPHGLLNPPADTGRGILALGLGEGAVDGD